MTELSLGAYAGMGAVVLLGACFQGVAGIGFSIICAPICALLFPALVPGPLLLLGLPLSMLTWAREAPANDWAMSAFAIGGRLLGTVLAGVLLLALSPRMLGVLFALCILAAVALSAAGWRVVATRGSLAAAGVASGVMGTVTSAGGPPFAIVMQHMAPPALRATLSCIFTVGTVLSLAALAMLDKLDLAAMGLALLLMPWLLAGFAVSGRLARHVPPRRMRHVLLGFAALSALGVLAEAAFI